MEEEKFFEKFSLDFLSGEYNQFIFSGNIYDIYMHNNKYYNLSDYLVIRLSEKRTIIKYSLANGLEFVTNDERDEFIDTVAKNLSFFDSYEEKRGWVIKGMAQSRISVVEGLKLMKEASKMSVSTDLKKPFTKPFAFILEHAETIAPNIEVGNMSEIDRQKLVFLRDWLCDEYFIKSHDLIIFISQTVSEIQKSLVDLPSMDRVVINYPDFDKRKMFIEEEIKKLKIEMGVNLDRASDLTAGLNLNGIHHILLHSQYTKKPISEEEILIKTEDVIKGTIGDYIRVINPDHSFKDVIGATKIKMELLRQVEIIKMNNPSVTPRGFLICGRNGVGKTYIMEAFANELGWLCIELKNMRQKYLGETDVVFERVKNVLESFKNVLVLIDEADTFFGGRGENVHETEKRLTGNFIKMIGDPKNRGKIIWVFITSRPDCILPDFIRRLEIKIGFFNPSGNDRLDFLKDILKKVDMDYDKLSRKEKKLINAAFKDFSPAEFKLVTTQLKAELKIRGKLSIKDIILFINRFNLNIGREKYKEQDALARKFSTFKDLIE